MSELGLVAWRRANRIFEKFVNEEDTYERQALSL